MNESETFDRHRHTPWLKGLRIAGFALMGVVGAGIFALAFGWLVMILWNWLMPVIFHLGSITYWEGFGIVILAKLIFGGMGRGGHMRGPHHGHGGPWGSDWGGRKDNWRYYRDFWRDEGRQAFESYASRRKAGEGKPAEGAGEGTKA